MHANWMLRWVTNLDPAVKRVYAIATQLHPCFKTYDFIDGFDFIPESDKAWALQELRTESGSLSGRCSVGLGGCTVTCQLTAG